MMDNLKVFSITIENNIIIGTLCCIKENNNCKHAVSINGKIEYWDIKKIKSFCHPYIKKYKNIPDHFRYKSKINKFPFIKRTPMYIESSNSNPCYHKILINEQPYSSKIVSCNDICKYFIINNFEINEIPNHFMNIYMYFRRTWRPKIYHCHFLTIYEDKELNLSSNY